MVRERRHLSRTKQWSRVEVPSPEYPYNFKVDDMEDFKEIIPVLRRKPLQYFVGKQVQAGFEVRERGTGNRMTEWMWVPVEAIDPERDILIGRLGNQPIHETPLKMGDIVNVTRNQIRQVNIPEKLFALIKERHPEKFETKQEFYDYIYETLLDMNHDLDRFFP